MGASYRVAAQAPARTAALEWRRGPGAESCFDVAALARRVEARLGRPVFVARDGAEVVITGAIDRTADGKAFAVSITMAASGGAALGSRELVLEGARCEDVTQSVALIVAVMLDPDPARHAPPPPPPLPPALKVAPRLRFGVDMGVAAGAGLVPGVGPGGLVRASFDARGLPQFALRADGWLPTSVAAGQDARAGARSRFQLFG